MHSLGLARTLSRKFQCIPWAILMGVLCFSEVLGGSSEVWEARYLLAKAVIELRHEGQEIHGVVFLKEPFRKVATYHFKGWIEEDRVTAWHFSGHSFQGRVADNGEVVGSLTTKKGTILHLAAKRR